MLSSDVFLKVLQPMESSSELLRLGRNEDGGYVVTERMLEEATALFTYGVGWDISFEEHFVRQTGKKAFLFDHTIRQLPASVKSTENIELFSEGIAPASKPSFGTFAEHLQKLGYSHSPVILKMDIEGAEYEVLENLKPTNLINVVGLTVEFHWLGQEAYRLRLLNIVRKLSFQYFIAHVHGNNYSELFEIGNVSFPRCIEITFARRPCVGVSTRRYPVTGLDYPNAPGKLDYQLPFGGND
ncbi:hypothetical protein HNQ64_001033 [Prosthecobacter dejongeii]|uniref:Methyltransferase FkbM domain-containing protein n=2 Tax=Prosthecobacter dejongeii TaxID=48465 RepID=A0A7W8DNQ5_9BACT|nr:hypothetical protein [Prosthecobacter dejongeii]